MGEHRVGGLVVLPGTAKTIDVGGFDVIVLADAADTENAFSLIETREAHTGGGPPLHVHLDAAESFYVIEGVYRMHVDGRDFTCPAGSFIHIPPGIAHTFAPTQSPSRKLNLYTPAAMVGYFGDLAQAIQTGVDERGLDEIAERYQMEIVGPIPEGYL